MNTSEWIGATSAAVSVGSCLITIVYSRMQARQAEGQAMLAMRSVIEQSTGQVVELLAQYAAICDETPSSKRSALDKRKLATLELKIRTAIESKLNIYDTACTSYLERRINKRHFKKTFIHEICAIVDGTDHWHKACFFPEATSKYQATLKVYREWKHPE